MNSETNSLSHLKNLEVDISVGEIKTSLIVPDSAHEIKNIISYGLGRKRAEEIVSEEITLSFPLYDVGNLDLISCKLLEIFGDQHVSDALNWAYHFMSDFDIDSDAYINVLQILLENRRPEQLIAHPEPIRRALEYLEARIAYYTKNYEFFSYSEVVSELDPEMFLDKYEEDEVLEEMTEEE